MNVRRGFLLALIGLLLVLSFRLVQTFLSYFLLALLVAFVLHPLQRRLAPRLGDGLSASILVVGAVIAFFIPFLIIGATVAGDAIQLAQRVASGRLGGFGGFGLNEVESLIQQYTGQQIDLTSRVRSYAMGLARNVLGSVPGVLTTLSNIFIGLGLALFVVFFLLKDGDELVAWLTEIVPLPREVQDDLYTSITEITWAVLLGHVLVAAVQGTLAGIGLFVVGIPNATLWTFLMTVLALIPFIGAFLIWGPAAIFLITTGQTVAGVALAVWGTLVVNTTDNFLRPFLVEHHAKLNPSIIIVGILGGVYLIGFMGLFVGPVIVGALKAVLEVFDEYYDEL